MLFYGYTFIVDNAFVSLRNWYFFVCFMTTMAVASTKKVETFSLSVLESIPTYLVRFFSTRCFSFLSITLFLSLSGNDTE